jgi:hypothetical protein
MAALAVVVLFALLPFNGSGVASVGSLNAKVGDTVPMKTVTVRCGPAVVDAWRVRSPNGLYWFAYGPLDATTVAFTHCRAQAQHRLRLAGLGLLAAFGVLGAGYVVDRRRRHQPALTAEATG